MNPHPDQHWLWRLFFPVFVRETLALMGTYAFALLANSIGRALNLEVTLAALTAGIAQRAYFFVKNGFCVTTNQATIAQGDGGAFNVAYALGLIPACSLAETLSYPGARNAVISSGGFVAGMIGRGRYRTQIEKCPPWRNLFFDHGAKELVSLFMIAAVSAFPEALAAGNVASFYWIAAGIDGYLSYAQKRHGEDSTCSHKHIMRDFMTKEYGSVIPAQVLVAKMLMLSMLAADESPTLALTWLFGVGILMPAVGLAHAAVQEIIDARSAQKVEPVKDAELALSEGTTLGQTR